MKFSVFTPTHDPKYIGEVWESLKDQPVDFEWLIGVNGHQAPKIEDERIRYIRLHGLAGKIGALKRALCEASRGDVLVEVDHDDVLAPNALPRLGETFLDEKVDFAYSECAQFLSGPLEPEKAYDTNYGWTSREEDFRGIKVRVNQNFKLSARSMCHIEFAPDHVRAWRRSFYDSVGRHDDAIEIGDDHDLVCRTYLSGTIASIPECLYYYRMLRGQENTFRKRMDRLKVQTEMNRNKYLWKMVERWCDLEGLPRIDLGGALDCPTGWEAFDREGTKYVGDAEVRLPFEDNSIGAFRASDFLEHVRNSVNLMNEIWRCLVPGGWLLSYTPSTDGKGAFCDPTHVSFWNNLSFRYYTDRNYSKYIPAYKGRFQAVRVFNTIPTDWHRENNVPYVQAELCALKGQRQPGVCLI